MTTLAELFKPVSEALNWWKPAGALTGKASVAVAVFLGTWLLFHLALRYRDVNFGRVAVVASILLGLGLMGTFPPFFELFTGE